jgi:hypothetical protein
VANQYVADNGTEKFLKRLIGKKEVEDSFQQLDLLSKEEKLMAAARILGVVSDTRHDVKAIKDNLEVNNHGARHLFNVFKLALIFPCHMLI